MSVSKRQAALTNFVVAQSDTAFLIVNGIVLVPLYLTYVPLNLYGAWLATGNVMALLGAMESGIGIVLTQRLARAVAKSDLVAFSEIAFSGLCCVGLIATVVVLCGGALAPALPGWFKIHGDEARDLQVATILAAIAGGMAMVTSSLGALPQACLRTVGMGVARLLGTLFGISVTAWSIVHGWGVYGFGAGLVTRFSVELFGLLAVISYHWRALRIPRPRWSATAARSVLGEAGPMFFARLSRVVGENSQAAISAALIAPSAAAILVLTSRLVMAVKMCIGVIGSAVFGGIANVFGSGDLTHLAATVRRVISLVVVSLGVGLGLAIAFNQPLVSLWVGKEKYGGELLNLLIVIAAFVEVLGNSLVILLQAMGSFRSVAIAEVMAIALRLSLMFVLGSVFGIEGLVLGGLMVSLGIGATMLPRILARTLDCELRQATSLIVEKMPRAALCLLVALVWRLCVPMPHAWSWLCVQGALCFLLLVGVALLDVGSVRAFWYRLNTSHARKP